MKKEGNGVIYYLIYKDKKNLLALNYNENSKKLHQNKPMESLLQYLHNGKVLLYWDEIYVF